MIFVGNIRKSPYHIRIPLACVDDARIKYLFLLWIFSSKHLRRTWIINNLHLFSQTEAFIHLLFPEVRQHYYYIRLTEQVLIHLSLRSKNCCFWRKRMKMSNHLFLQHLSQAEKQALSIEHKMLQCIFKTTLPIHTIRIQHEIHEANS